MTEIKLDYDEEQGLIDREICPFCKKETAECYDLGIEADSPGWVMWECKPCKKKFTATYSLDYITVDEED